MMRPIGPNRPQRANQKQPLRPLDDAIHAPTTPQTSQTGAPNQSRCMKSHSLGERVAVFDSMKGRLLSGC
jgi:hypothetical protein